jgi:hypothetical protein
MNVSVNKCIQERVKNAFASADAARFPIHSIGGFNIRTVATGVGAGKGVLSAHSFGLALDINAAENCHATNTGKCQTDGIYSPGVNKFSIPANSSIVQGFAAQGLSWGGAWTSSKDYMHFSCTENEHGNCP